MDYLGLLTLGAFVGAIAALGVRYIDSVENWQKVLLAILPAILSGVAIAFVDRFKYSPALGAYPLGLIVAFLWTYSDVAVKNIARLPTDPKNANTGGYIGQRAIGVLHLLASSIATLAALAIALPPAIKQIDAEWSIKNEYNIQYLKKQRELALVPSKTEEKPKGKEAVDDKAKAKVAPASNATSPASTASGT